MLRENLDTTLFSCCEMCAFAHCAKAAGAEGVAQKVAADDFGGAGDIVAIHFFFFVVEMGGDRWGERRDRCRC